MNENRADSRPFPIHTNPYKNLISHHHFSSSNCMFHSRTWDVWISSFLSSHQAVFFILTQERVHNFRKCIIYYSFFILPTWFLLIWIVRSLFLRISKVNPKHLLKWAAFHFNFFFDWILSTLCTERSNIFFQWILSVHFLGLCFFVDRPIFTRHIIFRRNFDDGFEKNILHKKHLMSIIDDQFDLQ